MTKAKARGVTAKGGPFESVVIDRRAVGPKDVLIDIKYVGICHSDIRAIHTMKSDHLLVPGHEIAGVVAEVGSEVTKHKVGDRVGVGCMVNSCGECKNCLTGNEQACLKGPVLTYNSVDKYADNLPTQGGYSSSIVVTEDFVLSIPNSIELDTAAPLLCAGITTYSPLKRWQAGPGKSVAIIGLGGLGHMAVKIAHAMGAKVTVLSRTLDKKEDGLRLGADSYYATEDEETFTQLAGSFDLILNTVSADINTDSFLSFLGLDGILVTVGIPEKPLSMNAFSLILNRRAIAGSSIGGIQETQEMLDFCAEHAITADVEVISADKIDEAYDRVRASDVRYRFVVDTATL